MSDQIRPKSPEGDPKLSQPATGSEGGVQSQASSGAEGLTAAQQSALDKMEARINKRLQEALKTASEAGVQLTQEQLDAARGKVADQLKEEDAATETGSAPSESEPTALLNKLADGIMDKAGVSIEETDPEASMIDWSDPASLAISLPKAIAAKQKRAAVASLPLGNGRAVLTPLHAKWSAADTLDAGFENALRKK